MSSRPPSAPPMGFVILSHRDPDQLLRLITTLNRLYDAPPIVCHHDERQSPAPAAPANVRFVRPSLKTGWAKWSVVEAFLAALRLLYASDGPRWFTLLSGADYPVMRARQVMATLEGGACDAYIDAWRIGDCARDVIRGKRRNPQLGHFDSLENRKLKRSHYLNAELWLPFVRRDPRWRLGRYTIHLPFEARNPFTRDFCCYYGDHWFTANAKAAAALLSPTDQHRALQRHLRMRTSPDECYYQSVLLNDPSLSISIDNKRWAEWNGGGAHPMTMNEREVPIALESGAYFARKFKPGDPTHDMVDAALA